MLVRMREELMAHQRKYSELKVVDVPLHADPGLMAQPGGDLVLDSTTTVPVRRILHLR
jgi:hypothetical protein